MTYAGFWKRFAAAFIDGLVLMAIFGVVFTVLGVQAGPRGAGGASGPANVIGIVIAWLYFALMESNEPQGTLGKLALGIQVTDLDGQRVGFGRATGRHFAKFISGFILMIGYLMAAFTEKKQALHDLMAGCLVINR